MKDDFYGFFSRTIMFCSDIRTEMVEHEICLLTSTLSHISHVDNLSYAQCLTNAQPLPVHRPAADDNSLIVCTSHDLTDDWSLASTHFGARLGAFFY